MWRFAVRRAFFLLVGFLLLAVPLFAGFRYAEKASPCFDLLAAGCGSGGAGVGLLLRDGLEYTVSLAAVLLALAASIDLLLMLRTRLRRQAK